MFYKNWPYWIRGGIILEILGIFLTVLGFFCQLSLSSWDRLSCAVFYFPVLSPLWIFLANWGHAGIIKFLMSKPLNMFIAEFILVFIIGSIIGFIYGLYVNYLRKINK